MIRRVIAAAAVGISACSVPLQRYPAYVSFPEGSAIQASQAEMLVILAREYPRLEVLRAEPGDKDWEIRRHASSGFVLSRKAELSLGVKHGGKCFYTRPLFVQDRVGEEWGPLRLTNFIHPHRVLVQDRGDMDILVTEEIEGIPAAPLPCAELVPPG